MVLDFFWETFWSIKSSVFDPSFCQGRFLSFCPFILTFFLRKCAPKIFQRKQTQRWGSPQPPRPRPKPGPGFRTLREVTFIWALHK